MINYILKKKVPTPMTNTATRLVSDTNNVRNPNQSPALQHHQNPSSPLRDQYQQQAISTTTLLTPHTVSQCLCTDRSPFAPPVLMYSALQLFSAHRVHLAGLQCAHFISIILRVPRVELFFVTKFHLSKALTSGGWLALGQKLCSVRQLWHV